MKKTYPLLHAQTGILMACRKQPQCTRYNLPSAIPFSKKVEPGRLEEALRRVVECRPALRTRLIVDAEGRVRQYSDPGLRMDIVRRTMGEKQLTDYLNDGFVRPFRPFGQEPLCRFEVVETESHVWLLMDFHHIIADGFTLARNLMGRDLPAAYDGKTVDVEPRTLYDAAETEEQQEDSMAYCAARDYYGQLFRDVTFTSLPSPAAPVCLGLAGSQRGGQLVPGPSGAAQLALHGCLLYRNGQVEPSAAGGLRHFEPWPF